MTDYNKLVEALREAPDDWYDADLHRDAAAAIEALEAEVGQWKAAVKGQEDGIKVLQAEVERLEPKRGEIVRCKDCKWYQEGYDIDGKWFSRCNGSVRTYGQTTPDWFCADGERKVQE